MTFPGPVVETNGEVVGDGDKVRSHFQAVEAYPLGYPMEAACLFVPEDARKLIGRDQPLSARDGLTRYAELVHGDQLWKAMRRCRKDETLDPLYEYLTGQKKANPAGSRGGKSAQAVKGVVGPPDGAGGLRRATKAACSGLAMPFCNTASTPAMSPRSAAGSSHNPGRFRCDRRRPRPAAGDRSALAQDEPIHFVVQDAIDDVFAHAGSPVNVQFRVEGDADVARRHLDDEFGRPFHVVVGADAGLAAARRVDEQKHVRLRLVIEIQTGGAVVAPFHTGRGRLVVGQPTGEMVMRSAVATLTHGRRHVNDPFN